MRVLDLSRLLPGPYCSRILCDFGAEVIRIERPGGGDWSRHIPPIDPQTGEGQLFGALNRGKKSLTLNLKAEEGKAIFLKLVETADVVLESFRPGVMERLGLGHDTLAEINPRLIYCSLSGYGQTGEYRNRAGHDLNYEGLAGLLDLTGPRGGAPCFSGAPVADISGALWATIGILQALVQRQQTGLGQRVDASLLGGALSTQILAVSHWRGGQPLKRGSGGLGGGLVCYKIYRTQDGAHMTLTALEPEFWMAFCQAVGREDLVGQATAPAMPGEPVYEDLCALFQSRTRQDWVELFAQIDACCEPIYDIGEALNSAPVQALQMLGNKGLLPPVRLSAQEVRDANRTASLGQHTDDCLLELGYRSEEINALRNEGII